MATKVIKAIIEKASDGGYGIYCPDLEGYKRRRDADCTSKIKL